jgi:MFS family permease
MNKIKMPELISLILINISLIISWIAYNEYQPVLVQKFGLEHLGNVLIFGKAFVLIFIPIIAGFLTDYFLKAKNNYFLIYTVGIAAAGMTFMSVASMIPLEPSNLTLYLLPVLVVIWLIAMNLFVSPATSLVDLFAPKGKLPTLMAALFITSELTYALEPIIIDLILFLGPSLTFVTGGVLVVGSGIFFIKQTKDEIIERSEKSINRQKSISYFMVVVIGLILGLAHSFIYYVIPSNIQELGFMGNFSEQGLATSLLIIAALLSFPVSIFWSKREIHIKNIYVAIAFAFISGATLYFLSSPMITFFNTMLMLYAYVTLSIVGLPYIITRLNGRQITLGIGIFIGAAEVFDSYFEIMF